MKPYPLFSSRHFQGPQLFKASEGPFMLCFLLQTVPCIVFLSFLNYYNSLINLKST